MTKSILSYILLLSICFSLIMDRIGSRKYKIIQRKFGGLRQHPPFSRVNLVARIYASNYDIVAEYVLKPTGNKKYLGMRPRSCRFCGRHEGQVKFKNVAHAVSEMVGNKNLITLEECNDCNAAASEAEADFGKFTHADRTLGQVKGKGGVPSVKSNSKFSRIDLEESGLVVRQRIGDELLMPDMVNPGATSKIIIQSYRPQGVYKALVKMALTVIPRHELQPFQDALKWISTTALAAEIGYARCCYLTFTSGPLPYPFPIIRVLRRKKDNSIVPYATVILGFGNLTFQIFLPAPRNDKDVFARPFFRLPPAHPTPHFDRPYPYNSESTMRLNLSSKNIRRGELRQIRMHADSVSEQPVSPPDKF